MDAPDHAPRRDRQVGLGEPKRVSDRGGEPVEAVPLQEQSARVAVLLRADLPCPVDAQWQVRYLGQLIDELMKRQVAWWNRV